MHFSALRVFAAYLLAAMSITYAKLEEVRGTQTVFFFRAICLLLIDGVPELIAWIPLPMGHSQIPRSRLCRDVEGLRSSAAAA
jgi:hypothetical protein